MGQEFCSISGNSVALCSLSGFKSHRLKAPKANELHSHAKHLSCGGKLNGSVKEPNISIFFSPPITQWCSVSDVLFTDGRECQILVF